jgi:FtsP/CotA-like multicopper oxidase with cupredoxin domain
MEFKRRTFLKYMAGGAGAGIASPYVRAVEQHANRPFTQSGLVFPQTYVPSIISKPSPPARPFVQPLFIMPDADDVYQVDESELSPAPDPRRHQRYFDFQPQKFYVERLQEAKWVYHPDPPYNQGSWHFGWGVADNPSGPSFFTPGAVYKAFYDEPILVRRINDMPPIGQGRIKYALPSFSVHLHNAHTASESDGIPSDYFNPGEFWDHHYGNLRAGGNDLETMSTLWYHDHRLDFTAPNVYAGISGPYFLFDERDSNNEEDTNPQAFRLPSGEFDIPLMLHDVQFDEDGQAAWNFSNPDTQELDGKTLPSFQHATFGMLGDQYTVNRVIRPYHEVKRRKYRFRLINGGPSRLYNFSLRLEGADGSDKGQVPFTIITSDGNFLTRPLEADNLAIWVANRYDIIIDFSKFDGGDRLYLTNHMEMKPAGDGPTGRYMDPGDRILQWRVLPGDVTDPSQVPAKFRDQPTIDFTEVRRERLFVFDYDNGLFTINGKLMDPNRVDAAIEQGSAEIWTFRNEGTSWGHPIHTHFEEFQIFERNGRPIEPGSLEDTRGDVVQLGPGDEVKFYGRWRDFLGRHVMHCHNVVHEDHAMMIRWDIVPPGQGD